MSRSPIPAPSTPSSSDGSVTQITGEAGAGTMSHRIRRDEDAAEPASAKELSDA